MTTPSVCPAHTRAFLRLQQYTLLWDDDPGFDCGSSQMAGHGRAHGVGYRHMYSTCTFCYTGLGANEVLQHLGVGRRVAFDPARGCVWVVCNACARWNLAPIEERWEAVEECERLFRGTTLRYSSGNIGLAWVHGDLDLIRVGPALRPEVAAWRYGRQLMRPSTLSRRVVNRAGSLVVSGLRALSGSERSVAARARSLMGQVIVGVVGDRVVDVVPESSRQEGSDVPVAVIRYRHLATARLVRPEPGHPWALIVPHDRGELELRGEAGISAAARMLAVVNGTERASGFSRALVEAATQKVDESALPDSYFNRVLSLAVRSSWGRGEMDTTRGHIGVAALEHAGSTTERLAWRLTGRTFWGRGGIGSDPATTLLDVPLVDRLALEMAAHEESERRALDGELAALAAAWREADEIATIADALLG